MWLSFLGRCLDVAVLLGLVVYWINLPPPYAVLVGTPAKIVGVKFSLEQILKHESNLYPEHERMSRDELEVLFEKYYKGLKSMGTDYLSPEEKMKSMQYANMQYKIW